VAVAALLIRPASRGDCRARGGLPQQAAGGDAVSSGLEFTARISRLPARKVLINDRFSYGAVVALKSVLTSLQKTVKQLQATQEATGDKKPETR
jgi:hypothetical protein